MNMAMDYTPHSDKAAQADLETYSVLVADDDRTMADLLATNLRRLGHRVVWALHGTARKPST
jgi:PleD family two-component response regulator